MRWRSEIEAAAKANGVDPILLAAIVRVESGGDPRAIRYEPGYRWLIQFKGGGTAATEKVAQQMSWGLGQIMGATAREVGFAGPWLTSLLEPELNLEYCSRFLAYLLRRYRGDVSNTIAAYNAGRARLGETGYANQSYVDKVLNAAEHFGAEWTRAANDVRKRR